MTGQGEDYTTVCLLGNDSIKNHYKLIPVDLSRKKELYTVPKAFQQIEFIGQLEHVDSINADVAESMFIFAKKL